MCFNVCPLNYPRFIPVLSAGSVTTAFRGALGFHGGSVEESDPAGGKVEGYVRG